MFTKKHFETIAEYVRTCEEPMIGKAAIVRMVLILGTRHNDRFSSAKFMAACKMPTPIFPKEGE